ncbi:S8 family peptidase [Actinoplanes sp. CA-142083]|uniref:S8 family peptidase n=1 Tax=Actinoplanes sp. CA-142083 TaxID=3239903 RepID=UPI003D8CC41E
MRKKLLLGAALMGAVASASGPVLGHHDAPEVTLPSLVSVSHPVRVVSTTLDARGRPVVTARTATDRESATKLIDQGRRARNAVGVELDGIATVAEAPEGSDPLRDQQWDLETTRTPGAWAASTGDRVTVAVVDTGVASDHPDLAGQVLPGADFVGGVEGIAIDPNGHGTHVAGVIAAAAGNGVGIAGVAPDARILPVRVLGANGSGYLSDVANGIVYAAEHGADVINLSVSATMRASSVTSAIEYARSRGIVVVAAAGNSRGSGSPVSYPAAEPGVIAVAATDRADRVASYSNAGDYVDVAAPGSGIVSTFPSTGYRMMNGTSMATPHVAGLAALIRAADPRLGPDEVERAIESTAVDLGAPGRDDDYGYGRVDATAALAAVAPRTPEESPSAEPTPSAELTPTTDLTPTTEAAPEPTPTPTPSTEPTPSTDPTPSADPTPTPSEAAPTPSDEQPSPTETPTSTPTATESAPAPAPPVDLRIVRAGPAKLFIVVDGLDGQTVQLQRYDRGRWTTVHAYPATLITRLDGLATDTVYRVVVPASGRYAETISDPIEL